MAAPPQRTPRDSGRRDMFDSLPDDVVIVILSKLSSSACSPSDFINILLTCRKLKGLGMDRLVLSRASAKCFTPPAAKWSSFSHDFINSCAAAGNFEACYTLGMIRFYCLQDKRGGASLMAKAAMGSHALSLYSVAVILFNGSGGRKTDKDLRAGVALCARAASLGHIDAIRELGHCLQDGYGVKKNVVEGRRFLVDANTREFYSASGVSGGSVATEMTRCGGGGKLRESPLLSDYGWSVPAAEPHPARRFMLEWYERVREGGNRAAEEEGRRVCSQAGCGRRETRRHEYRRCSVCSRERYCSRACQALHWKLGHKEECVPPVAVDGGEAAAMAAQLQRR